MLGYFIGCILGIVASYIKEKAYIMSFANIYKTGEVLLAL